MAKKYGFGIIGAGMIGGIHAEAIKGLPNAELVSICDNVPGAAEAFGKRYGCQSECELDKFMSRDDLDVVTVATPSGLHAENAIAAARYGKHCIVEKPIDISLEKIDRMIEAHAKAGTKVGGVFNMRYDHTAKLAKQAVDQGRFGRLTFGLAYGPWWRDQSYYDKGGWRGTWAMDGGGALMNQGIHTIDMLQWLMGPVKKIHAFTKILAHERIEVEDTASATLEFANGALGTIACTTSMWPGHFRTIEISGDRGTVAIADNSFFFWQFADEKPEDEAIRREHVHFPAASVGASDPKAGLIPDNHRANFADFLEAIEQNREPTISGHEARKSVEIILAIYRSAQTGQTVEL
ncbi:MAG: Gfo/Idh/MocA family oxidoreductase [Phycisphaerales bacterium]|nr:Gfo/Idh/MocA family oxidoreductase [Phycisphaerales bacterium]